MGGASPLFGLSSGRANRVFERFGSGLVAEAGHFAINAGANRASMIEFRHALLPTDASRMTSRLPLPCFVRALLFVVLVGALPAAVLAQTATGASDAQADAMPATADGTPTSLAPDAASAVPGVPDAASRQKALDQRTAENGYRYGVAQHNCYARFFVNKCLDSARAEMRVEKAAIRDQQLALDSEQRAARAQQREQQAAIKRAQDATAAPQRAATAQANEQAYAEKQRQNELQEAQRNAQLPQQNANQAAYDQKQAAFQNKLNQAHQQAAQDAQQRLENQQKFTAKQQAAAQHKADVQARQKQAEQKREKQQSDQQ
jgi:hypothetical protein